MASYPNDQTEVIYTLGGLENLQTARKYYASTIDLTGGRSTRALFGICLLTKDEARRTRSSRSFNLWPQWHWKMTDKSSIGLTKGRSKEDRRARSFNLSPFVDVFKDTFIPDAPQLLRQVNNRSEDIQNVSQSTTDTNGPEGITEVTLQEGLLGRNSTRFVRRLCHNWKTSTTPYSIANYIKYDHLVPIKDFIAASSTEDEPSSYKKTKY
ncbi:hypothetical protein HAX54_042505 [Datura stramonium]|uniref:ER membrane protein complex subunit 2 n=1 Tax=Datura stramonium TaxID=4076 RepID=A0ABS8VZF1_DATST|nr:hypothetical protein [Datura stramonium]